MRVEHVEGGALAEPGLLAHAVQRRLRRLHLVLGRLDALLGSLELGPGLRHGHAGLVAGDAEIQLLLALGLLGLADRGIFGAALVERR